MHNDVLLLAILVLDVRVCRAPANARPSLVRLRLRRVHRRLLACQALLANRNAMPPSPLACCRCFCDLSARLLHLYGHSRPRLPPPRRLEESRSNAS